MHRAPTLKPAVALGLAALLTGCSSHQLGDAAEARAALEKASEHDKSGEYEAAAAIYLECLASCPRPLAHVGQELHALASRDRRVEQRVWDAVAGVEKELPALDDDERAVSIGALSSVYGEWRAKARVAALRRDLRRELSEADFRYALVHIAALAPAAIDSLSTEEASMLDAHLAEARKSDLELKQAGRINADVEATMARQRMIVTVAIASALMNGGRADLCNAALDRELPGSSPTACDNALETATTSELTSLTELICSRCATANGCKKEPALALP